ncbi:hypothetical protein SteCoe_12983 [Stentor coeruleus]|uniref:Uncharacterized protein n=1 Tax=Stentor coeruleus TaxID=5963 RepID=A0A1R2C9F9_9CILI|nr:hypothetical protein SteCoe_12983 [Stentor coeruleus]
MLLEAQSLVQKENYQILELKNKSASDLNNEEQDFLKVQNQTLKAEIEELKNELLIKSRDHLFFLETFHSKVAEFEGDINYYCKIIPGLENDILEKKQRIRMKQEFLEKIQKRNKELFSIDNRNTIRGRPLNFQIPFVVLFFILIVIVFTKVYMSNAEKVIK